MSESKIRRPRGQRVELVCDHPACRKVFVRDRSHGKAGRYTYCGQACKATSPFRRQKGEYVHAPRRTPDKLTGWFDVATLPAVVGLYRAQTQNTKDGHYIDAWWEGGCWWAYDEGRRIRHASLTRLTDIVRWRGRTIPPDTL